MIKATRHRAELRAQITGALLGPRLRLSDIRDYLADGRRGDRARERFNELLPGAHQMAEDVMSYCSVRKENADD